MRKVIGSSPISSTKKKTSSNRMRFFFFCREIGLELKMRYAGGISPPPVQKLVATLIAVPPERRCTESYIVHHKKMTHSKGWVIFLWYGFQRDIGLELQMRYAGGISRPPFQKLVATLIAVPRNGDAPSPISSTEKSLPLTWEAFTSAFSMSGRFFAALRMTLPYRVCHSEEHLDGESPDFPFSGG